MRTIDLNVYDVEDKTLTSIGDGEAGGLFEQDARSQREEGSKAHVEGGTCALDSEVGSGSRMFGCWSMPLQRCRLNIRRPTQHEL
jgi:hypothetical protein